MIEQVLREIRDFFIAGNSKITAIDRHSLTIENATHAVVNQYIYLAGTMINGGVYKITSKTGNTLVLDQELSEEPAIGTCYFLAIPRAIITLTEDITDYNGKNKIGIASESLGDYSVTYSSEGTDNSWKGAFATRLNEYRRPYLVLPTR